MVKIGSTSKTSAVQKASAGGSKKSAAKSGGAKDSVQVSDAAGLRERAKVMLADMPDVRLEQIEGIREALEQGTYQLNQQAISAHIVRNALSEHSWG